MADSMDSFFAKKDKKKKSKNVAALTTEELARKMELVQNEEPNEPETTGFNDNGYDSPGDQPKNSAVYPPSNIKDDEEWNEYEGEKVLDITGLKIQNLNLVEKERIEEEEQEELQKAVEESKSTMKWNIATNRDEGSSDEEDEVVEEATTKPQQEKQQPEIPPQEPAQPATGSGARYVPPALRKAGEPGARVPTNGMERISIKKQRNQKIDVTSVDQFPSLGAAVYNAPSGQNNNQNMDGAGLFTSVRKGAKTTGETGDQNVLSTSNKYAMLKGNKH